MIERLKPYPAYKDSGLPWLGRVPGHWDVKRLGALLRERGEKNERGQVTDVLSLMRERGVIPYGEKGRVGNKKSDNITRYKIVRPDDVVVNCMNVIIGSVGISRYTGCLSPVYYVLTRRFEEDNPNYLNAYFQTKSFQLSLVRIGNGILSHRMRIPMELLKCELFPRPPAAEQAAIVRFLDHATHRMDKTIRAKRKTITLLNEQKQAIIHRAVTRGIAPDVPLKDSGISWLGQIPAHWDTPLLGRCVTHIEQGWSPVASEGEFDADQWVVLTLSSVRRGVFDPAAIKPVSKFAEIPKGIEVANGDVLLTRSNTRDRVGDVCIVEGVRPKTILCDLIYRLTIQEKLLHPKFLVSQLLSPLGRGLIERDARGSSGTMPKISQSHIKSWRILLPPMEEQQKIIANINSETVHLVSTIQRFEREIDLLREYRTRLIADVVTGKLDVREAAARLPEVASTPADEPELAEMEESGEELAEEHI